MEPRSATADPSLVRYEAREGLALLRIDSAPANALSTELLDALSAALGRAARDAHVRGVVLMGADRTFMEGADLRALEAAAWGEGPGAPDAHRLLREMEEFAEPIVVTMHGAALGGGLEVAMAGHYRVALASAQLGFPDVNLGLIPGAGGTQRLPRLVGVETAIEMCVSGRSLGASDALAVGLIDEVVEADLERGAIAFARRVSERGGPHPRTRERNERLGTPTANAALLQAGREMARRTRPHQTAPLAVIDAIRAATELPFLEGIRREREIFARCLASEQCRALLHVSSAERAVSSIPDASAEARPREIRKVAIVGAGTMGGGIAMACANAGLSVSIKDDTGEALDAGLAKVRANYEASVRRGRLTPQQVEQRLASIQPQLDYANFGDADLVIEAVFESMELKKRIFAELDAVVRPGCVLGTNTSTLDIDRIAAATSRSDSVVGLHFFSPANVMRLLEVVRGRDTSPEVLATATSFAKRLRKIGVLVGNGPGFVGNRMMFPYMYEAQFLVEEGATPEQVDRALTDFGMAMGIFAVDDLSGLDVTWRIRQESGHFTDPAVRRPRVADRLYGRGRLGQKTGAGWYRYENGRTAVPDPEVLALIERTSAEAGIGRRSISTAEILDRTVYSLINEGARVLEEGLASRASDIDVIYVNGYGFPGWRGGPMFHADRVGLGNLVARLAEFEREHGQRWKPAPLLVRLAAEEKSFRERDAELAARADSPPVF